MDPLFNETCKLLEQGQPFVLATIFDHQGSTPRTSGARMIIRTDGTIFGTIGGGLLEARVIKRAPAVFEAGGAAIEHFDLNAATVDSMDMICGGNLSVLLEHIASDSDNLAFFTRWRELTAHQADAFVISPLPDPRAPAILSAKWLLETDGTITGRSLADIDPAALLATCRTLKQPAVVMLDQKKFHIEPITGQERLYLFGAGHVSQSVARLAHTVGFSITVVDDRPEFANRQRFGHADEILVPGSFDHALDAMGIDRSSYIAILTRGHLHDHTVLAQALRTTAGYIGMIGSKRKRNAIYTALLSAGFSRADLDRVHSPIGLEIGAETPEEIAVSIVSQLIAVRAELRRNATIKGSP